MIRDDKRWRRHMTRDATRRHMTRDARNGLMRHNHPHVASCPCTFSAQSFIVKRSPTHKNEGICIEGHLYSLQTRPSDSDADSLFRHALPHIHCDTCPRPKSTPQTRPYLQSRCMCTSTFIYIHIYTYVHMYSCLCVDIYL